jgi:hypothetical protein
VKAGIALLALPAVYTLTGCGKSSSDSTPAAPGDSFSVVSSLDAGHTHNIEFHLADFVNPSGDKTYTSDGSHQHTITLTQQQLTSINTGATVGPIVSSNVGNHTHTWTIKKPA